VSSFWVAKRATSTPKGAGDGYSGGFLTFRKRIGDDINEGIHGDARFSPRPNFDFWEWREGK
jgi:hypothetical protein